MTFSTSATSSGSSALVTSSSSISRAAWPAPGRSPPAAAGRRRAGRGTRRACRPGRSARAARSACASRLALRQCSCTLRGASVTLSSTVMCGNRLNDWNTMPIRRRTRFDVDAAGGDLRAADEDPAGVDRLQQVDAAQQRRLARARRRRSGRRPRARPPSGRCRAAPRASPKHLRTPSIRRAGPSAAAATALMPPARLPALRSRATSQSVNRASGIVISDEEAAPRPGRACS